MRPVSDKFLRTLRGSHRAVFEARIVSTFQTGVDPDGVEIPIIDGDVRFDATADVRATAELITDGRGWTPTPDGLLAPYGNELWVRRGIEYGDGVREWVSLGYFRITDVEQDDAPNGRVRISASDRMKGIIDARLVTPRPFTRNHTARQVIENLVHEVYPDAQIGYDFNPDGVAMGRDVVVEEDRYAFLRDLAASYGKVMYWDHQGILQFRHRPDPRSPVWEINTGRDGVLVAQGRSLSREGVYNAVVASGEGADTQDPVRAVAYDDNPRSPTYWEGRFGKVPRFYSSPFITTIEQARSAAQAMLAASLGLPYSIDVSAVPNPALEVWDPVLITNQTDSALHVIEQLTIPLRADAAMTGTTRDQSQLRIRVDDL